MISALARPAVAAKKRSPSKGSSRRRCHSSHATWWCGMLSISVPSRSKSNAEITQPPRRFAPTPRGGATVLRRLGDSPSHALLQARLDERIEVAVEHLLRVADLDVGAQVLDAALVEHVRADLVAPADVGLAVLELLLLGHALAHLVLEQARAQHLPRLVAVAVLRA